MARDTLRLPVPVKRFATSTPAKAFGLEGPLPDPAPTPRPGDAGADFNDATTIFGLPAGYDDDTQLLGMELQANDDDTMVLQQKAFGANQAHLPGVGLGERLFEMLLQPQQQPPATTSNALEVSRTIELGSSLVGRTPQKLQHSRMKPGNLSSAQKRNLRTSFGAGGQTYIDCELDVRFGDDIITEEAEDSAQQEEQTVAKQTENKPVRRVDWISQIKTFDKKSLSAIRAAEVPPPQVVESRGPNVSASHVALETAEDVFQVACSEPYRDTHSSSDPSSPPPPPSSNRKTPSRAQRQRRQSIMSASPAHFQASLPQTTVNADVQTVLRRSPRKSHHGPQAIDLPTQAAIEAHAEETGPVSVDAAGHAVEEEAGSPSGAQVSPLPIPDQPALRRSPRKSLSSRKSLDPASEAPTLQRRSGPEAASSRLPQQARKSLPSSRPSSQHAITQQQDEPKVDKLTRESISKRREDRKAKRAQNTPKSHTDATRVGPASQMQHAPSTSANLPNAPLASDVPTEGEVLPGVRSPTQDEPYIPSSPVRQPILDIEEQDEAPVPANRSPFTAFRRLDPLSPVIEDAEKEREKEMSMERSLLMQRALAMQTQPAKEDPQPVPMDHDYEEEEEEERQSQTSGQDQVPDEMLQAYANNVSQDDAQTHEPATSIHSYSAERDFGIAGRTSDIVHVSPRKDASAGSFPVHVAHAVNSSNEESQQKASAPIPLVSAQKRLRQAPELLVPSTETSQVRRPASKQSERPRSRQSTASSQIRAKVKGKPYERPKPSRTASVPQPANLHRDIPSVASTSRLPAEARHGAPSHSVRAEMRTDQPRGRSRNVSVPVNFSPGQKKRPKPNVSRQVSVDDMFSRRQRDGSRGRGLETASQPDSTTSFREARSENARSVKSITLAEPREPALEGPRAHLSVQDKQKQGLLTQPKSFTFASSSASVKRKRDHDTPSIPTKSKLQHIAVPRAAQPPRKPTRMISPVKQSAESMANRCQAEIEAQEDECIVPLTKKALKAHEILDKSSRELGDIDQSLSAAEHNKTAKSETVLRFLKQLAEDQPASDLEPSNNIAAEDAEQERLLSVRTVHDEQQQDAYATDERPQTIIVQDSIEEADGVDAVTAPARAKRARLDNHLTAAVQPQHAPVVAHPSGKPIVINHRSSRTKEPMPTARGSSQRQRQSAQKAPRLVPAKATGSEPRQKTARHMTKPHPTQPQPFTFMSVGKEQSSFSERLRTWQEREETAARNGKRALQPLLPMTRLQNTQRDRPSKKDAMGLQKQPLEVRPFTFPSDKRMEERREWEERLRAKERIKAELAAIERAEAEAREAAEIREMRRHQIIRANPLPAYITDKRIAY